jgi:SpoVK/Ycf46/Vps4 family AAA+-type ATPase
MIGLDLVKNSIVDMILYYLQNFEKKNNNMLHTIIEGPPGVGKTQLGKILAEIYAGMGVIKSNKFKLVKRTDLVGEFLGHTAHKTQKAIDEADGGVLFIDEAYSLGNEDKKDSFSKECIDTLCQNLSENKKKFICIIAGYPDELDRCFFSYNPGLRRRFPFRFRIDGYNPNELKDIFIKKIKDIKWSINEEMIDKPMLLDFFVKNKEEFQYFGGDVDNLLINCKFAHSRRLAGKHPKYRRLLSKDDLEVGFKRYVNNKKREGNLSANMLYTMYN